MIKKLLISLNNFFMDKNFTSLIIIKAPEKQGFFNIYTPGYLIEINSTSKIRANLVQSFVQHHAHHKQDLMDKFYI